MNPIKKIVTILLLVTILIISGVINYRIIPFADTIQNIPPESVPFPSIETIEITYTETTSPFTYRFYKIGPINNTFYSNTGIQVESQLIQKLKESFTDLYISDYQPSYQNFNQPEISPHFDILITLTTGKQITVTSDSDYHCFIPWNIIYDGAIYVQYNGKIPGALLKILEQIDPETWAPYKKDAKFGCYSVEPGTDIKLSHLFPHTTDNTPLSEIEGASHLVTHIPVEHISSFDYKKGMTVVRLPDKVVFFSADGKEKKWEFKFNHAGTCNQKNVSIYNNMVIVGGTDTVYSIDAQTGDVIWEYPVNSCSQINIIQNTVLVIAKGVLCLNAQTGDVIWEITDNTWNEKIYGNTLLFAVLGEETTYYRLKNILTGEVLWEDDFFEIKTPVYKNGSVYFYRPKDRFIIEYTIETGKEVWLYPYTHEIYQTNIVGDHLLIFSTEFHKSDPKTDPEINKKFITGFTVLHVKKADAIHYGYAYPIYSDNPVLIAHHKNFLILARDPGIIEAFDKNGNLLWRKEVRGDYITSLYVYENNIYATATDGKIYCLNEYGTLLWRYTVQHELHTYPHPPLIFISTIEDGLIFVLTEKGVYTFNV